MHPQRRQLRERQGARVRASFTLVAPLASSTATDMLITDTSGQLDLFAPPASGAVARLSGRPYADPRPVDVESANDRQHPGNSDYAYVQNFANGNQNNDHKDNRYWGRAVRSVNRGGVSFSEMLAADLACRRNKRTTATARAWEADRESNIAELREALNDGMYAPRPSICFVIERPKKREVWAAAYRDRVAHHLLYNHVGARFERSFITDSCACIPGRGTHYAARRLERKIRSITRNWKRPAYYLKCDLSNFFPSIDKTRLVPLLEKRIPEPFWLELALKILLHDPRPGVEVHGDRRRLQLIPPGKSLFGRPAHLGLPIGNLSSQFDANIYLDVLDKFVKHRLRVRHYVRYVDDFILLHESAQQLNAWLAEISAFLPERLGVDLNPHKTILQTVDRGIDFVGHVIRPHRTTLRRRTLNDGLHRLAGMPRVDVAAAATSYLGLARQASHSHRDRTRIANAARRRGFSVDHQLTKVYA